MATTSSSNTTTPPNLRIGIIGFGPFAQFLSKTILRQGHSLTATSRSDHSNICTKLGIEFFQEISNFIQTANNDVIMICTSILSLSQVLTSIPFHLLKKPTLFVDVLSVKEYPKELLLQVVPEESDVLCTHPMFGPESGKYSWEGLPFVFDKIRITRDGVCSAFLSIFHNEGCRMMELSCEEHDRRAARSQFLTHTIGRTLSEMDISSTSMDTKGFESLLHLKDNSVLNSFDLYCGLFVHNRFAKDELKNLELALETVKQKLLHASYENS